MESSFPAKRRRSITGAAAGLLISLLALSLLACAALGLTPAIAGAVPASPTAPEALPWSIVEIAKPTQTPLRLPTSLPEAAEATQTPEGNAVATDAPADTVQPTESSTSPTDTMEATSALTMRIVDPSELPTAAPAEALPAYSGGKYIRVSIREQHLYAYDNDQLTYSFVASTGMGNSTRVGTFHVLDKIPNAYGSTWNIWMPNWLGIYYSGSLENGIHALPILPSGARLWSGYLGTPISFGCVVLGVSEALQIYNWADIGTPVEISW